MKILVVTKFQNEKLPIASFVMDQIKTIRELGNSVLVIVLLPFGKKNAVKQRYIPIYEKINNDNIDFCYMRYISISKVGRDFINPVSGRLFAKALLKKELLEFSPDIIHAHTFGLCSEVGAHIKRIVKCPLVITTHGSDTVIRIREGKCKHINKWSTNADAIICVGSKLKSELERCSIKAPTYVIHNGFNSKYLKPARFLNRHHMIQVCNLKPEKNVDTTIIAFSLLKKKYGDFKLTIVGEGEQLSELIELCKALHVYRDVQFTGAMSNEDVLTLMSQHDFFVMTSSPEGFGIVYLEAMASNCITIGTQGEGIADIIDNSCNGFLVPAKDAKKVADIIEWCIGHPVEANEISENGKLSALSHTWHDNAKETIDLFCSLNR